MDFISQIKYILKISNVRDYANDINKNLNSDFEIMNNVVKRDNDIYLYSKKFNTIISIDLSSGYPRLSYSETTSTPGINPIETLDSEFNFYNPKAGVLLTNEDIFTAQNNLLNR
jgi:hypothetical protein